MDPGSVPDQLKGLTQAEEMLIAKGCPVDLLMEPMPLERLSKIGDTPTLQLRLREEVRLNALAGETLRLHGGVEWWVYKFMLVSWRGVWNANNTLYQHQC